ncbi:hypothetical protein JOF53_008211 [Crossiella equi]|uniref:Glycosyltransferase RgtA/B/C/D-like domain-containing protein n=1 Tax=Crossiella equi TaxID=130796 RepID=A0ABS5ARY3_9PSEU|nr:glycosyltransferase family 39 protein [Crossiella equi]MBP2479339.1 hypothetical protein [Crossiella equi]
MTTTHPRRVGTDVPRTPAPPHTPVNWRGVLGMAAAVFVTLLATASLYSYHADELYFRLLGERGWAWGYVDQPPLLPAVVDLSRTVFGDTQLGIRVPAALCAAAIVVLCGLIAAELGGTNRGQLLAVFGVGTSTLVLTFGHWILTSSFDTVATCAVLLFTLRALLREEGRWWIWTGVVCGVALHAKFMVMFLPVCLLLGLLLVGPRKHFLGRHLYLGMGLTLLIGSPNLIYQILNDYPQLQMAQALGELDGADNRAMFATNLLLQLGPLLTLLWLFGLYKLLRAPQWRPVAALGVGYLVATAAALFIEGGRPDYTGGFLLGLLIAGAVAYDRWLGKRTLALVVTSFLLALTTAFQVYLGLPLLPERLLGEWQLASMQHESVGWTALVEQTARVYQSLPPAERQRAVFLAENFGQAGALDRYAQDHGIPADRIFSGHNELHKWGPPPETADVVISLGAAPEQLAKDFASCEVLTRVDNGIAVDNPEQGREISVCRGHKSTWQQSWPAYRHLGAYL